jgi:hypothetical protein
MPRERRTLTFDQDELIAAIYALADGTEKLTLDSPIIGAKPNEGRPVTATLDLVDGGQLELGEAALGAALILHCVRSGVPLPKGSDRTLRIDEGKVQLVVNLHTTMKPATKKKKDKNAAR